MRQLAPLQRTEHHDALHLRADRVHHLEEDDACRVDVDLVVVGQPRLLLWRHVESGAHSARHAAAQLQLLVGVRATARAKG